MDGSTFIKKFRAAAVDEAEPYLWSDDLVLSYLDEAQVQFCVETEGLPDRVDVEIGAGDAMVAIPPYVLKIRKAILRSNGRELDLISEESLAAPRSGVPRAVVVDGVMNTLTFDAVQSDSDRVILSVFRLPRKPVSHINDRVETPRQFDSVLMHYALHLAFSRPDADTYDKVKATTHLESFMLGCRDAERSMGRRRKPNHATNFSW